MPSLAAILSKYEFKAFRPGENENSFSFSGPGICIISLEHLQGGERIYQPLEACESQDALSTTKRLLAYPHAEREQGYLCAFLAIIPAEKSQRLAVLAELSAICKTSSE